MEGDCNAYALSAVNASMRIVYSLRNLYLFQCYFVHYYLCNYYTLNAHSKSVKSDRNIPVIPLDTNDVTCLQNQINEY